MGNLNYSLSSDGIGQVIIEQPVKKEDKRIGYIIRLFPSQQRGKIIDVKTDKNNRKKIVVKTTKGDIVEIDDLPYLYEILKKE